jgi:hypothetical protein
MEDGVRIRRRIMTQTIKPIVVLQGNKGNSNSGSNGNKTNAALALKRALIIASLGHTMSIAQCKGIYPA